MPSGPDSLSQLRGIAESCDPAALSYLWLAIESGCSILVLPGETGTSCNFINAICAFVPRWQLVFDLIGWEQRINFARPRNPCKNWKTLERRIGELMPDRIIMDMRSRMGKELFGLSRYGTSIIAAMPHVYGSVVKALRSRQFMIQESEISNLDISIFLNGNSIKAVTEYRWLSRAELDASRQLIGKFENSIIAANGSAINHAVRKSKLVEKLARRNLLSIEETMHELAKRASFISGITSSNIKIEDYFEIR